MTPNKILDPVELTEAAGKVMVLRRSFLVDISDDGSDIYAQEHFMLALAALDQAERYLRLASYHQARDNARSR